MVTQAYAQEAVTPAEEHVTVDGTTGAVDATHADPTADTHATTEAHDGGHSDVFPPFDPATFPSQLLWLAISFAALYLLMSKLALPRVGSILEERKARIDADIAAADASRQKTDAAIAAYEAALAAAKAKAQGIAAETGDAIKTELATKRKAVEADLASKVTSAEARIAATKAAAMSHVDEIAAETAQTVVTQLVGDVSADSVRAAVAKASKE
ncbi:ATP F0F1 synthase subunit B' [Devosia epidermidihirudinis]|uniref:ATP synthase subunit b n=2 Tax=Devosia epidermidihirudinis TaxID=1293439 RepID=A0A0F5QKQ8_9HYPH|nr:F0F1 ATP synthase subunit B [Devosia epidermidihirudinis]KKC41236.1 ATP F0F1 synthase subunit B' [Devosia epidermidihirudinis]KKC41288.1 ATP F0F1 synthase subunit B' [Devosia epidermidihirudinis]